MKRAVVLLIGVAVACASVPNKPASLQGTVIDREGNTLPGVTVTLHTAAGDRVTFTDATGRYAFSSIPPARYVLQASLSGFHDVKIQINVRPGKNVRRKITIGPTAYVEAITVTAACRAGAPASAQ
jgi:hypothetical protein